MKGGGGRSHGRSVAGRSVRLVVYVEAGPAGLRGVDEGREEA